MNIMKPLVAATLATMFATPALGFEPWGNVDNWTIKAPDDSGPCIGTGFYVGGTALSVFLSPGRAAILIGDPDLGPLSAPDSPAQFLLTFSPSGAARSTVGMYEGNLFAFSYVTPEVLGLIAESESIAISVDGFAIANLSLGGSHAMLREAAKCAVANTDLGVVY